MANTPTIPDEAEARIRICHAELVSASITPHGPMVETGTWTLKQVQGDGVCFGEFGR